jgi:hypothetical protein
MIERGELERGSVEFERFVVEQPEMSDGYGSPSERDEPAERQFRRARETKGGGRPRSGRR